MREHLTRSLERNDVGWFLHHADDRTIPARVAGVRDVVLASPPGPDGEVASSLLAAARTYVPTLPVLGVAVPLGLERILPVLNRSDHAPFWVEGFPAIQLTDTADFRNPHYHWKGRGPKSPPAGEGSWRDLRS